MEEKGLLSYMGSLLSQSPLPERLAKGSGLLYGLNAGCGAWLIFENKSFTLVLGVKVMLLNGSMIVEAGFGSGFARGVETVFVLAGIAEFKKAKGSGSLFLESDPNKSLAASLGTVVGYVTAESLGRVGRRYFSI